jgi:eukaryotic-like serine/threonine-protein kinase
MSDPVATLREGLRDRYAFERELGRGGMAIVYLAQDLRHERPVALKILHPELAATLGPDRFLREIKLAARLQHPHILTVLDSGETGGRLWFTMPFVEGESLRDRLRRERQLPVDAALRIAVEAARGLDYAHQHGVAHRDVKPENILLTQDGSTLVADFGIARALGGDDGLTQTGMAVGTPAYMSPEQAAGDRSLDARTDQYSLAAVLYEMLSGEAPWTGATAQAITAKRLTEPAPSVRAVRPTVPAHIDEAIRKALAPVAADRYATMAELVQVLTAVGRYGGTAVREIADAPASDLQKTTAETVAGAVGHVPPYRPTAVPPRRRLPIAALALILGLLIGAGALFAWRRSHANAGDDGTGRVVAVLPFENLGDSADAYFADGVADEVRTKLSQVAGLVVIARGSSIQYRGTTKRPAEIARELGADYLLSGTVRWEKAAGSASRVRVTPELVEAHPGQAERTRWGEQFDASMTNVFEVQADIATKVADALGVALADSVRAGLEQRPTENLEAYDAFLKGEAETAGLTRTDPPSLSRGLPNYQRAVALDSSFLAAWARLAQVYSTLYSTRAPTPELASRAAAAAEQALRLGPSRPEGYLAQGSYERLVLKDDLRALATLKAGLELAPSNAAILGQMSATEQTLGDWNAAVTLAERAAALDPRSPLVARRLAAHLMYLRRYPEAEVALRRAVALAPTNLTTIHQAAELAVAQGDLARAERIARTPPPGVDPTELAYNFARFEEMGWLLDDAQQRRVLELHSDFYGSDQSDRGNWGLVNAHLYALRGQPALARAYADSARLAYQATMRETPDDAQQHALLGVALAFLGRRDEAIREAERAVAMVPIEKDAYFGPYLQLQLARVQMMVGSKDKAVELLKPVVEVPNNVSRAWLRLDPSFAPLRKLPAFQALVGGTS